MELDGLLIRKVRPEEAKTLPVQSKTDSDHGLLALNIHHIFAIRIVPCLPFRGKACRSGVQ